jgi:hypothetical protein
MNDGGGTPQSLNEVVTMAYMEPAHLSVLLPILHEGDPAVYHWSAPEGQNAMWSRSGNQMERGRFACIMAMRARQSLEELAVADGSIEVEPFA